MSYNLFYTLRLKIIKKKTKFSGEGSLLPGHPIKINKIGCSVLGTWSGCWMWKSWHLNIKTQESSSALGDGSVKKDRYRSLYICITK